MHPPHLIILCGVPGSGKSTLALHLKERWGAVSFASETFADRLGAAARGPSGDLTPQAIVHAYAEMSAAVNTALATGKLVVAVGSFRAEHQRQRFREVAGRVGATATTVRVVCPVALAAERVRLRRAHGERGPSEPAIGQIDAELNRAADIGLTLLNDGSVADFLQRADAIMETIVKAR